MEGGGGNFFDPNFGHNFGAVFGGVKQLLLMEEIRRSPVDLVKIRLFTEFDISQVVGNGISEPSTVPSLKLTVRT